MQIIFFSQTMG